MTDTKQDNKQSVDFSNYNPYYKDVAEYIKACNKARLMYKETRDLEPFYTAIDILVNTTAPYIRGKLLMPNEDGKEISKIIFDVLDEIGNFMRTYHIMKRRVRGDNVKNTVKAAFITKEGDILFTLTRVQRKIIKDLSFFKILPRVSIDYVEEEDDGLAFS